VDWFLRAAEAGFPDSFIELANLYNERESPVYNPAEAHKWYRVVAEYSEGTNSRALLALAHHHLDGAGVPCDLSEARLWLRRLLQVVPPRSASHREATRLLKKLDGQFL
jgi:TPR repeat protein